MVRAFLFGLGVAKNRPTPGRAHDERLEVRMPGFPATAHARTTGRRLPRRAGLAALFACLALLLTACGGGASGSAPEPATTTAQETGAATTGTGETTAAVEAGAGTEATRTTAAAGKNPGQATARYVVPTIACPSCAARVEANAEKDPGVVDVQIEVQDVTVTYDPAKTDPQKIADAIRAGGDTVQPKG
jgi:copper chaperone CopZ